MAYWLFNFNGSLLRETDDSVDNDRMRAMEELGRWDTPMKYVNAANGKRSLFKQGIDPASLRA